MDLKIEENVLNDFLNNNSDAYRNNVNILQTESCFLWNSGNISRFRINVWVQESVEGRYCPKVYIADSYFVHYNTDKKYIEDMTVEPVIDLENDKKGLFS